MRVEFDGEDLLNMMGFLLWFTYSSDLEYIESARVCSEDYSDDWVWEYVHTEEKRSIEKKDEIVKMFFQDLAKRVYCKGSEQ